MSSWSLDAITSSPAYKGASVGAIWGGDDTSVADTDIQVAYFLSLAAISGISSTNRNDYLNRAKAAAAQGGGVTDPTIHQALLLADTPSTFATNFIKIGLDVYNAMKAEIDMTPTTKAVSFFVAFLSSVSKLGSWASTITGDADAVFRSGGEFGGMRYGGSLLRAFTAVNPGLFTIMHTYMGNPLLGEFDSNGPYGVKWAPATSAITAQEALRGLAARWPQYAPGGPYAPPAPAPIPPTPVDLKPTIQQAINLSNDLKAEIFAMRTKLSEMKDYINETLQTLNGPNWTVIQQYAKDVLASVDKIKNLESQLKALATGPLAQQPWAAGMATTMDWNPISDAKMIEALTFFKDNAQPNAGWAFYIAEHEGAVWNEVNTFVMGPFQLMVLNLQAAYNG